MTWFNMKKSMVMDLHFIILRLKPITAPWGWNGRQDLHFIILRLKLTQIDYPLVERYNLHFIILRLKHLAYVAV